MRLDACWTLRTIATCRCIRSKTLQMYNNYDLRCYRLSGVALAKVDTLNLATLQTTSAHGHNLLPVPTRDLHVIFITVEPQWPLERRYRGDSEAA